ncbi:xylulokinase [Infirmifilum sp. NZ]|uniref:xylulokinase n=1 Tax=Infirmifilum sp. NZ TaxID=2926850 RepID=UPI00279ED692|nr:FGGY-family carbohydrate kinase [Infirmifilum sp. NZ]UNQ73475.1 FGGY-family carbohydrate kinase [Infirmifilum sp. NZ]
MEKEVFLVIDLGTSCLRTLALTREGRAVAGARRVPRILRGEFPFILQYDVDSLTSDLYTSISEVLEQLRGRKFSLRAIGVTAQRGGACFLDRDLNEIYVGPNIDARGFLATIDLAEDRLRRVYESTGQYPPQLFVPGRLQWFREYAEEESRRIAHVITLLDWVVLRLTGRVTSELSSASSTMLLDVRRREWSKVALEAFAVDPALLAEISEPGLVSENISPELSRKTGLPEKTPVVVCGGDTHVASLAFGATVTGVAGAVAGATCPVVQVLSEPRVDPEMRMWTSVHVIPGHWILESNTGRCGGVVDWFVESLLLRPGDYEYFDELVLSSPPGSRGVRFKHGASVMNARKTGEQDVDIYVRVPEFSLHEEQVAIRDVARSLLESISYSVRANYEQLRSVSGAASPFFGVTGGLTRLQSFRKILPAVMGFETRFTRQHNGTALGCLALTMQALGEFRSVGEAVAAVSDVEGVRPPEGECQEYNTLYYNWLEFYREVI